MQEIKLKELTTEQRKSLIKEADDLNKAARATKRAKEQEYKDLVSETVVGKVVALIEVSRSISTQKQEVYDDFEVIFDLKREIYPKSVDNNSHTFTSKCGKYRLELGYNMLDSYDDTVNEGVSMVKDFINSLVTDKTSKDLVNAVLRLLSKDNKGNLKASRVMQLKKIALENGDENFIEGVRIIEEAYNPQRSKRYVRASVKGGKGEWMNIPLGMTEA